MMTRTRLVLPLSAGIIVKLFLGRETSARSSWWRISMTAKVRKNIARRGVRMLAVSCYRARSIRITISMILVVDIKVKLLPGTIPALHNWASVI